MPSSASTLALLRANFAITTWLLMGATLQSVLVLVLPTRVALLPAVSLLLLHALNTALVQAGWVRNPYLAVTRPGKWTAPILEQNGSVPEKGAGKEVVVFIVGASANQYVSALFSFFRFSILLFFRVNLLRLSLCDGNNRLVECDGVNNLADNRVVL